MVQNEEVQEQFAFFIRSSKRRNYTVLDNAFLQDTRLSWKAKGLFAYILSLPENWKIYQNDLLNKATDGVTSFRTAKKELLKYGYIRQQRYSVNGNFVWSYLIIENPNEESEEKPCLLEEEKKDTPQTEDKKVERKKKVPLIEREPVNDLEKIEKAYLLNYKSLYEKKVVTSEEPVVNWLKARSLGKMCLEKYGLDTLLLAIERSVTNEFVVKNGYCLTMILSAGVLTNLINGNNFTNQKGFKPGQGVDLFRQETDVDF